MHFYELDIPIKLEQKTEYLKDMHISKQLAYIRLRMKEKIAV